MVTIEQAVEFKRLFQEYENAIARAGTMLRAYGIESEHFSDADGAAALLWRQLSKFRGMA